MKTFRIESYEQATREMREMFEQELDKLRTEHDDATGDDYQRIGYAISDIEKLLDALYDAEQAFGGLECDNEQVLKRMGLL